MRLDQEFMSLKKAEKLAKEELTTEETEEE